MKILDWSNSFYGPMDEYAFPVDCPFSQRVETSPERTIIYSFRAISLDKEEYAVNVRDLLGNAFLKEISLQFKRFGNTKGMITWFCRDLSLIRL